MSKLLDLANDYNRSTDALLSRLGVKRGLPFFTMSKFMDRNWTVIDHVSTKILCAHAEPQLLRESVAVLRAELWLRSVRFPRPLEFLLGDASRREVDGVTAFVGVEGNAAWAILLDPSREVAL